MTNFQYWDEERETLTKEKREKLILDRLKHQLEYVYSKTLFTEAFTTNMGSSPKIFGTLKTSLKRCRL